MKYDELSFVNTQLAAMLRDGIPLEGGLKQICAGMRRGPLRAQLEALEADLAKGVPIDKALDARQLPELYTRMLRIGARGNDLPGMLTMLADYYGNASLIWDRLKGLMVYPILVLIAATGLSVWITVLLSKLSWAMAKDPNWMRPGLAAARPNDMFTQLQVWLPPLVLAIATIAVCVIAAMPALRRELCWRLPAFKDAAAARLASALAMLLKSGCPLPAALDLMARLEAGTSAGADLELWRQRCAQGHGKFSEISAGARAFPPMFIWMVSGAGEDIATGFQRAAAAYQSRAAYRTEMFLYAVLPASLLFLGLIILGQIYPLASTMARIPNMFMFN